MLSDDDKRRYARQIILPNVGEAGQERLIAAKVLMVGAGGLGASALSYLAACGIGEIGMVDDDQVELSNLNRQIIHETGDIGRAKVQSAADRLSELNPDCIVTTHKTRLSEHNASTLIQGYDLVLDGSDNFATRYAINRACLSQRIPWIYAAVRGFEAQYACFLPNHDNPALPCYRCFIPEAPGNRNDCAEHGVLGALVGIIGSVMVMEAVKLLLSIGSINAGMLMRYDGLQGSWKSSRLLRDPHCADCSEND